MFDVREVVESLSKSCPKCQFSDSGSTDVVGLLTAGDVFCRKWSVLDNSSVVNVVQKVPLTAELMSQLKRPIECGRVQTIARRTLAALVKMAVKMGALQRALQYG